MFFFADYLPLNSNIRHYHRGWRRAHEQQDEVIAVVRFNRQGDTDKGEYAALVEDRWQGRGLGLAMTYKLIEAARGRKIRVLHGSVMLENKPLLKLLRSLDLLRREHRVRGTKYVEIDLAA